MKGILDITLSSAIFLISGYLINILLARSLGPVDYGLYGIVISILSTINLIQTSGLPQSTSRFISINENKSEDILRSSLILQIISTLVITTVYFLLSKPIALLLKDLALVPYLQLSSLIFPLYGIFALYSGYCNGLHQFKTQAKVNIVYSVAKLFGVVSLGYYFHLYGAISGFVIAPFVALLFGFHLPVTAKITKHFPYKKLIFYSLPLIGFAFFSTLAQSVDLYFIKAMEVGDTEVGLYAANQNISRIPYFALSAFAVVLFPAISKSMGSNDKEKTKSLISNSVRYILLLLTPLTLLLSATSKEVLDLLFSKSYLGGADSLSVLLIGVGFLTLFNVYGNILNGAGEAKLTLLISLFGVILISFLCYLLVPSFGIVGGALATTLGSFLMLVVGGTVVYLKFKAGLSTVSFIKIILSGVVVYMVADSVTFPLVFLPIGYILLFGLYVLLLKLLKEINDSDIKQLISFVPFKRFRQQ